MNMFKSNDKKTLAVSKFLVVDADGKTVARLKVKTKEGYFKTKVLVPSKKKVEAKFPLSTPPEDLVNKALRGISYETLIPVERY